MQAGLRSQGPTGLGLDVGVCEGQAEGMEVGRAEGAMVGACGIGNVRGPSSDGQPIGNLSEHTRHGITGDLWSWRRIASPEMGVAPALRGLVIATESRSPPTHTGGLSSTYHRG